MSICRVNGQAVFVPYGVPGDVAEIELVHSRSSYAEAVIHRLVKPSHLRVNPPCPLYGSCGGCDHQNIGYESQLALKTDLLREIFRHFITADGRKGGGKLLPPVPSPELFGYRNKMQLQCVSRGGRLLAGFYERGTKRLIPVASCPLHSDGINACASSVLRILNRNRVNAYDPATKKGAIKDILIRESEAKGDLLLTLVTAVKTLATVNGISKSLFRENPRLKGFYLFHNPHVGDTVLKNSEDVGLSEKNGLLTKIYGNLLEEKFAGINMTLSPLSFFQVNPPQAENICSLLKGLAEYEVMEIARNTPEGPFPGIIDAHAGIGTFSLPMASFFKRVMGVEIVSHACDLARGNAIRNGIRNFTIKKGDAAEVIKKTYKSFGPDKFREYYTHLLLDPPRAGLTPELAGLAASLSFKKIWYVSCNPHTQARDAELLMREGNYTLTRITPFDMFPHTGHIETVMELTGNP